MRKYLDEEEPDDTDKETEETEEQSEVEEVASKITKLVKANLGLDKEKASTILNKVYSEGDLTKNEKVIIDFFKAIVSGDKARIKALSEGTDGAGGYLIPTELYSGIIAELQDSYRMRSLVRVVPMTRRVLDIPTVVNKPKVYWTAENAAKSTATAEFSKKTLTAYKCAAIIYCSDELMEDFVQGNLANEIIKFLAEAVAEKEDEVLTKGTGVGQPTGLTVCNIGEVTCGGALSFDNIIDLVYSLPSKYRRNAIFLVNNANIREMRKLKDQDLRYLWQDAVAPGQPDTFHGYPVYENNNIGSDEIYFGDLKQCYWMGVKGGISVTISREAGDAWSHDETGIRIVERFAGNCVLEAAMRKLVSIP
jgi:HK97 family phage major capsid protein